MPGLHYMNLYIKCTLKEECLEYISFLQGDQPCLILPDRLYYESLPEDRDECIPYSVSHMQELWFRLSLQDSFLQFDLDKGAKKLVIYISKRQSEHPTDLYVDYVTFMKQIIVPMTTHINLCYIEDDQYMRHKIFFDEDLRKLESTTG